MTYMFAGFLVLWALLFAYVFSISARQRRIEQQIALLRSAPDQPTRD